MMNYCPTSVATVMNIWCSVARLLLWLSPVYHFLLATGTLYIYGKMLMSFDVRYTWRTPAQKRGSDNLFPNSLHRNNDTNGLWFKPNEWYKQLTPTDVKNIDANKFQKNSTGTRSHGKQWTHRALNIFELSVRKYDHLNNTSYQRTCHIESALNVRHLIYLFIYKVYSYIHGNYIWNRSVIMLTNNACVMKRNTVVKHLTWQER